MEQLAKIAQEQGLHALVLWSDLYQFYQNLGFTSIGREWRLTISRSDRTYSTGISKAQSLDLSDTELTTMLQMRPKLEWGIHRSIEEFRSLLKIPQTLLFLRRRGTKIVSWLAIGKGADMQAIIHEWGAISADEILGDIQSILSDYAAESLTLLVPGSLQHHWLAPLKQRAAGAQEHPMALGMPIGDKGQMAIKSLSKCFIWGLDSI
jgi:hypothetical protein